MDTSGLLVVTDALFVVVVRLVTTGATAIIRTVALAPAAIVPSDAVTVLPAAAQLPTVAVQEVNVRPVGRVSVTVVLVAPEPPMFCTTMLYIRPPPLVAGSGVLVMERVRSDGDVMVKALALKVVPLNLVTAMIPLPPRGTVADRELSVSPEKLVAGTPLKVTPVVPVKPEPRINTLVPTGPLVGLKLLMMDGALESTTVAKATLPPKAANCGKPGFTVGGPSGARLTIPMIVPAPVGAVPVRAMLMLTVSIPIKLAAVVTS